MFSEPEERLPVSQENEYNKITVTITGQWSSNQHYYLEMTEERRTLDTDELTSTDHYVFLISKHGQDILFTSVQNEGTPVFQPAYCTSIPESEWPSRPGLVDPSTLTSLGTDGLHAPDWISGKAFLYDMSDQYGVEVITYIIVSDDNLTQRYIYGDYTLDDPEPTGGYSNLLHQAASDDVWYLRYMDSDGPSAESEEYWTRTDDGVIMIPLYDGEIIGHINLIAMDLDSIPASNPFDAASVEAIIYKLQEIQSDLADGHTTNPPAGVTWSNTSGSAWTVEFTNFKIEVYADETETRTTTINGTCVLDISAEPRSRAGILSVDLTVDNKDGSGIGLSSEDPSTCEYKYNDRRLVWPN